MNDTVAGKQMDEKIQVDVSKLEHLLKLLNLMRFFHLHFQTELILLQFLHQKPKFSACGLFHIDMTFVYAVNKHI